MVKPLIHHKRTFGSIWSQITKVWVVKGQPFHALALRRLTVLLDERAWEVASQHWTSFSQGVPGDNQLY